VEAAKTSARNIIILSKYNGLKNVIQEFEALGYFYDIISVLEGILDCEPPNVALCTELMLLYIRYDIY